MEILADILNAVIGAWMGVKALLPVFVQWGMTGLEKYFFGKLLGAFVPAFFLAGAIGTWISKGDVVKYLSPQAPKRVAYPMATISGGLLSVCACGILPLFSAIYARGAGIGPAVTFLFAGPAINLIAIFYTFDLLNFRVGVARIVCTLFLSIGIGLVFERLFEGDQEAPEEKPPRQVIDLSADDERAAWQTAFPMFWMVVATVVLPMDIDRFLGASVKEFAKVFFAGGVLAESPGTGLKLAIVAFSILMVGGAVQIWFSPQERKDWLEKTVFLLKQIVPKIVLGIFLTGILEKWVGTASVLPYIGKEGVLSSFLASLVGGILYFGTILGVVAARFFMVMGVPDGPLLALLLAGPTVTLPSVFAITEIMGAKQAYTYFALVVAGSTLSGVVLGLMS